MPLLKNFNISSNFLVSLDVANSANLTTLNVMNNRLEQLIVTDCTALKHLYASYNELQEISSPV